MTTVAYCAVAPDGRTAPDQIQWTDEAMPGLRVLTDAVHAEGAAVSAQIGHAGPVADPRGNRFPALSPSTRFPNIVRRGVSARRRSGTSSASPWPTPAPRDARDRGRLRRGRGAPRPQLPAERVPEPEDQPPQGRVRRLAGEPGDGSPAASCARSATRWATGSPILTKLNMSDGVRGGITLEEAIQTALWIEAGRHRRRLRDDRRQLPAQPDVPLPRGRPGQGVRRGDAAADEDGDALRWQAVHPRVPLPGRLPARATPARCGPRSSCRWCCSAASPTGPRWTSPCGRASSSWPWAAPCCASPTWSTGSPRTPSTPSLCIHCNLCMPTNFVGTHCPVIHEGSSRSATWGTPAGYA